MLNQIGRFRDLPSWRKDFKVQCKKFWNTPITLPLNPKYRPDPYRWVCTCPHFFKSCFLICKHLVHAVRPVQRNRTTPFWSHPALIPLLPPTGPTIATPVPVASTSSAAHDSAQAAESDAEEEDVGFGSDNNEGLDSQFLNMLEREGAGFFRLAENCLSRKRRKNSTRSPAPATWEQTTANAMFYRIRPVPSDHNT
ncbi:hypothetical protein C8R43DRAFT_1087311 [Mycena crocata]|nr:hypothetical protein C8R43DRAFT_1087311 [Mycena crocata]